MRYMFVTMDVSKLTGWLNADACCRESKGGHAMRGAGREVRAERQEGLGQRRRERRHARGEGPTEGLGARARAGRTPNISIMPVTLDVSKLLSGWLNFPAHCRVEGEGNENAMRSEVRTGRREGLG